MASVLQIPQVMPRSYVMPPTSPALPAIGTTGISLAGFAQEALPLIEIVAPLLFALISMFSSRSGGRAAIATPLGNRATSTSTCAAAQRNAAAICKAAPNSLNCASARGHASGVCAGGAQSPVCPSGYYWNGNQCLPIGSVGLQ